MTTDKLGTLEGNVYAAVLNVILDLAYSVARVSAAPEMIVDHLEHSDATTRVAQIRVLGGAIARVRADATAFAHRSRSVMVNVAALYDRAEDAPRYHAWADAFRVALQKGTTGAYVNFLADDGPARIHEAYPDPTWDKLRAIKQRYDAANLFRLNQNVPP